MARLPLCSPKPGENEIADQIRQRRHPRDLIALDRILLHNPLVASGWNSLLGAIRTHSSLPDDFREILILRVAALNSAPYEWIQHEKVGRSAGLTTPQLMRIRDIIKPLTDTLDRSHVVLSDLHLAGLAFTDSLTREIQVRDLTFDKLKNEFSRLGNEPGQVTKMLFDAAATVSGYNMVSRMLVGLEIGDDRDASVDLPGLETRFEKLVMSDGTRLNVRYQLLDSRPTLMFCNSLLTNMTMWNWILPSLATKYNLICFDQRGHGQSGVPTTDCTLNQLADDVSAIVEQLGLQTPLHGLIGVSQGGATTLEMSTRSPHLFKHYVVCDTQPSSPSGARDVWKTRIDLAEGSEDGFKKLSEATISRWFPIESHMNQPNNQTSTCIRRMIEETDLGGFESGAAALYDYQVDEDRIPCDEHQKVLLLAGERDGSLPQVLEALSRRLNKAGKPVKFMTVPGAGHLPMVDQPLKFLNILEPFLDN
ncbi:hypothetical protein PGT21_032082 [Puccinia graminis f. sp. tritici]|uniref:AB hydrolase-1 domain-containing protein n=2 Tax=Puccinia graminis f. sp. tritici TaxID=56615 RepID=A0A5B0R273_PUCGR|nr:hypothetical protein PGT21_032082 [Puccinia graminis f. sp. tritici]